jgi:hypothetical protein
LYYIKIVGSNLIDVNVYQTDKYNFYSVIDSIAAFNNIFKTYSFFSQNKQSNEINDFRLDAVSDVTGKNFDCLINIKFVNKVFCIERVCNKDTVKYIFTDNSFNKLY